MNNINNLKTKYIHQYNNILLVDMWSYLRNQPLKQTNLVDLQFLLNYAPFSKNCCRKLLKKESRGWKYII